MNSSVALAGGLYAITHGPRDDLLDAVAQALAGSAWMLQYLVRGPAMLAVTPRPWRSCSCADPTASVWSFSRTSNSHARCGADGVHLHSVDGIMTAWACLGPAAIVGVACHDALAAARATAQAGANYVSFGAMFLSLTKSEATIAAIDLLRQSATLGVARVAIGGITPENAPLLIDAGADYIASISSLFGAPAVCHVAQRFAQLFPQPSH